MEPTEHQIQSAFIEWCTWKAQSDPRYDMIMAVPNEGKRTIWQAKKMKREGLKKGFPDVFVFVPSGPYHGLALEFKRQNTKPTKEQLKWLQNLRLQGYAAAIVRSVEHARETLLMYLALGSPQSRQYIQQSDKPHTTSQMPGPAPDQ